MTAHTLVGPETVRTRRRHPLEDRDADHPMFALQRLAGNQAVAELLLSPPSVQRCGPIPPDQCNCHDQEHGTSPPIQRSTDSSIQRACTGEGWKFEYDGCSLPARAAAQIGGLEFGGAAKDNPAGADDTRFAHNKSTREGGDVCDRHDECYQTCDPNPAHRKRCDDQMYTDMKRVCNNSKADIATKQRCLTYALSYWLGLRSLGWPAHGKRQEAVCGCHGEKRTALPAEAHAGLERVVDPRMLSDWIVGRAKLDLELAGPDEEQARRAFYLSVSNNRDDLPDALLVAEDLLRRMVQAHQDGSRGVTLDLGVGGYARIWQELRSCAGIHGPLQELVGHATDQLAQDERTVQWITFKFGPTARCKPLTLLTQAT